MTHKHAPPPSPRTWHSIKPNQHGPTKTIHETGCPNNHKVSKNQFTAHQTLDKQ